MVGSQRSRWLLGLACCVTGSLVVSVHQRGLALPQVHAQALVHRSVLTGSRTGVDVRAADIVGKVVHLTFDVVTDGHLTLRKEEWNGIVATPAELHPHPLVGNPDLPLSIGKFRGVLTDAAGQLVQEAWSADTSQSNADYDAHTNSVTVSHAHNRSIAYPVSPWTLPMSLNPMLRSLRHTEGGVQDLPEVSINGEPVAVIRITATGDVYYISKTTQRLVRYEWTYQGQHTVQTLTSYQLLASDQVPAATFNRPLPAGASVINS